MSEFVELAKYIKENTVSMRKQPGRLVGGQVIMDGVVADMLATSEVKPKWIEVIAQANQVRQDAGIDFPLPLEVALYNLQNENGCELAQKMSPVEVADFEELAEFLDLVTTNQNIKESFLAETAYLIPDRTSYPPNKLMVADFLQERGITCGTLIDAGCGTGFSVASWHKLTGLRIVGIERQYHPRWYKPYWCKKESKIHFLRGNLMGGLPILDNSVEVCVMDNVVAYMQVDALVQTLEEVNRILRPKVGVLAVAPVYSSYNWTFFEKRDEISFDKCGLVEV